jgi:hypothetical protein
MPKASHCAGEGSIQTLPHIRLGIGSAAPEPVHNAQQRLAVRYMPVANENGLAVLRQDVKRPASVMHEVHQYPHIDRVAWRPVEVQRGRS